MVEDSADFEDFLSDPGRTWDLVEEDLIQKLRGKTAMTVYFACNEQGGELLQRLEDDLLKLKARDEEDAFGPLTLTVGQVQEEDWANNWKQYFKPLPVGDTFVIKPSWEQVPDEFAGRQVIEIDPGASFGTGQHETTRLVLEAMEKHMAPGSPVLDMGCGSGILSVAASLMGAGTITGVDIDENAVRIARENLLGNGAREENLRLYCGNVTEDKELEKAIGTGYGLTVANIFAEILLSMKQVLAASLAPGAKLILSGIIDEKAGDVKANFEALNLTLVEENHRAGWTCLVFCK